MKSFLDKDPPINPRLRRAYLVLSQFTLRIFHLPGIKNELCDFLSRIAFEDMIDEDFENLAREAFVRMDTQIDLYMESIFILTDRITLTEEDFKEGGYEEIWKQLETNKTTHLQEKMFF